VVSEVSRNFEFAYLRLNSADGVRMNFLMQGTEQSCVELAAGLVPDAEKELAAYASAVHELFGSEQARRSVEDWMAELQVLDWPNGEAAPVWRQVTIASAIRLASRVNAPLHKETTEFPNPVSVAALLGCDRAI
jgi:hypothetical protein